MLRSTAASIAIALTVASAIGPAHARGACGDRKEMLEKLAQRFEERPRALGVLADGGLLEVVVSPKGSWTILISYPKGPSCVMAVGSGWRQKLTLIGEPV